MKYIGIALAILVLFALWRGFISRGGGRIGGPGLPGIGPGRHRRRWFW